MLKFNLVWKVFKYYTLSVFLCSEAFSGILDHIETIRASSSSGLYNVFSDEPCTDSVKNINLNSRRVIYSKPLCNSRQQLGHFDVETLSELAYFDWAAKEQLKINKCVKRTIKVIWNSEKSQEAILKDINTKLPMLKDLESQIKEKQSEMKSAYLASGLPAPQTPLEKKIFELKKEVTVLINTIWNGAHPVMNTWIQELLANNQQATKEGLQKNLVNYMKSNHEQNRNILNQAMNSSAISKNQSQSNSQTNANNTEIYFNDLDLSTKKALLQNASLWNNFTQAAKDDKDLDPKELGCRLQSKYGKGDDYFSNSLSGVSYLLGGGSALILRTPRVILSAINNVGNAAKITKNSANLLALASVGVDGISSAKAFDTDCISQSPEILHSGTSSCDLNDDQSIEAFEIANLEQGSCLLTASTAILPGLATAASYLYFKSTIAKLKKSADTNKDFITQPTNIKNGERGTDSPDLVIIPRSTKSQARINQHYNGLPIPVKIESVSNLPENLRVVKVDGVGGTNESSLFGEYAQKLDDGTVVRVPTEISLDASTGALDGNYSGVRKFFEMIAKAKAGRAHFAFIDVGSLRGVNLNFALGKKAGDRYIKAVYEAISGAPLGEGKITIARMGGDEFGLIIDEADPKKVKEILEQIQQRVRALDGDAHKVFREQKKILAQEYREAVKNGESTDAIKAKIDALAKIQQPDISVGITQIGKDDSLKMLSERSEKLAKEMKIDTAAKFSRDPGKYQSDRIPEKQVRPKYLAPIRDPSQSPSWNIARINNPNSRIDFDKLPQIQLKPVEELKRIKDYSIVRYRDQAGNDSIRLERLVSTNGRGVQKWSSVELPTKGESGLIDGMHPRAQKIIMEHYHSSNENNLAVLSLKSLKYINYWNKGTQTGDEVLDIISGIVKNKFTRQSDLNFKVSGADYLLSIDKTAKIKIKTILDQIKNEVQTNPNLKRLIDEEKFALAEKLKTAIKKKDEKEILEIKQNIEQLNNFDFDFRYQVLGHADIPANSTVSDVLKQADDIFIAEEAAH